MRKFYNHNHQKPLVNDKCYNTTPTIQSGLVPSIRKILQVTSAGGTVIGAFHTSLPSEGDNVNINYSKMSYIDKINRYNELHEWYEANKDVCDRVKNGDYSDFEPKPTMSTEPMPVEPSA